MLIFPLVVFVFAGPPAKAQPPLLSKALLDVHRLCKTIENADSAAHETIVKTKKLEGKFTCNIDIDKVTPLPDGGVEIIGKVQLLHADRERYRSEGERKAIEEATEREREIKADYSFQIKRKEQEFRERRYASKQDINRHNASMRNLKKQAKQKIKEQTDAKILLIKSIKNDEDRRREICENITTKIEVGSKLGSKIDLEKLLKKKSVKATVVIEEFSLGHEPQEIGGQIYVNGLTLRANSMKSVSVNP